ncbi:MAG TPA: outer membrane beta-barrel protein [Alphaproteobacteria bacterium]
MDKRFFVDIGAYVLLITIACASYAHAQTRTDDISAGGFIFKPSITISEERSDNIYTSPNNEKADFITRIKPEVMIERSGLGKNKLEFKLDVEQALYRDSSDDNYLNAHAAIKTRYITGPASRIDFAADYARLHAERGDDEADPTAVADEPIGYDRYHAKASLTHDFGVWSIEPRVDYMRYDYDDGSRISGALLEQDTRDRTEFTPGARLSYAATKETSLFADGDMGSRQYDMNAPNDRDSVGGSYLLGIRHQPQDNLLIEAAGGYMNRDYSDLAFDTINTWGAQGRLEWIYAPESIIKLNIKRDIAEVTDANVGGAVRTNILASISKLLAPDWTGEFSLRYMNRDYRGGFGATSGAQDREDHYYKVGLTTEYMLTKYLALLGQISHANNSSNLDTAEYSENVVMIGARVGF